MSKYEILERIETLAESLSELLEGEYDFQYENSPDDLINELNDLAYAAEMALIRSGFRKG